MTSVLWLLSVVVAIVSIRILYSLRTARCSTWWRVACVGPVLALAGTVALLPPWSLLQRTIGLLVMPAGLLWCALIVVAWQSWRIPRLRWVALGALCLYTLAANTYVASALHSWLSADYRHTDPLSAGPFDAVFVLGGGSDLTPDGRPQLGRAGDRIAVGAALYHRGATRILVCSGQGHPGMTRKRDLTEETTILWTHMGVPQEAIVRIPEPRNTGQEIVAYKKLIQERGWRRVGLISSARHLPRVMQQCRKHGLDVQPLPAQVQGAMIPLSLPHLVPRAGAFLSTNTAAWEIVGVLAGRAHLL